MILHASTGYWATGITVRCNNHGRWGGHLDFYDDGFCDDDADQSAISTQGQLSTRYLVDSGETVPALRAVVDTLVADAHRLGIRLHGPAESHPSLYYVGDGEDPGNPPPDGWEELLAAEAARLGWVDPEPPLTAVVTVNEQGHLTPESTVTVGEWTWPVPESYGTVMWMHRVGRTLRDQGWKVTGEARPSGQPGVYEVPVKQVEDTEGRR